MNVMTCVGRLGKDAEVRSTQSGATLCGFTIAVDSGFGDRKQTLWIKCTMWGKMAEGKLPEYMTKGKQVAVSGELGMEEWEDKNGDKRTTITINVNRVSLCGGGEKSESRGSSKQSKGLDEAPTFDDDDIPF